MSFVYERRIPNSLSVNIDCRSHTDDDGGFTVQKVSRCTARRSARARAYMARSAAPGDIRHSCRSFSEISLEFSGMTCRMTRMYPAACKYRRHPSRTVARAPSTLISLVPQRTRRDAESSSGIEAFTTLSAETRRDIVDEGKHDPAQTLIRDHATLPLEACPRSERVLLAITHALFCVALLCFLLL